MIPTKIRMTTGDERPKRVWSFYRDEPYSFWLEMKILWREVRWVLKSKSFKECRGRCVWLASAASNAFLTPLLYWRMNRGK